MGGRYGVSGAQPPGTLLRVLQRVWDEAAPTLVDTHDAGVCDDGSCAI